MSIYIEVELRCDGDSNPYGCEPAMYAHTGAKARRDARQMGWLTGQAGGKDYCARHRPKPIGGTR
jgi:hypothetical protein